MTKAKFYAYSVGEKKGIADSWPECQKIVSGVAGARYKGFLTKSEAERWLKAGADYGIKHIARRKGIYFDAGTGSGRGVEINVSDEKGNSLMPEVMPKDSLDAVGLFLLLKTRPIISANCWLANTPYW